MEKDNNFFLTHPSRRAYFIKNYFWVTLVALVALLIEVIVLFNFLENNSFVQLFFTFALIITVIAGAHTILHCKHSFLTLDEYKISYDTGIINRKRKIVPLDGVTDTSLERSVVDMILNTATLNVSTAGSRSYEISVSNLKYVPANYLHEKLHQRIQEYKEREKKKEV